MPVDILFLHTGDEEVVEEDAACGMGEGRELLS
jgi:hypothetical protein